MENERESPSVKHGIRVLFQTSKKGAPDHYAINNSLKPSLPDSCVIDGGSLETYFLESGNGKGGVEIRVAAGQYNLMLKSMEGEFILLDGMMRPGSVAEIPFDPCHGLVIYILEGVGIFKRQPSFRQFYENEGHGIWFPPLNNNDLGCVLHVTCHMWSSLRFLAFAVLVS
ncbi:hypothetical protein KP509_11G010000 [Ceratopteris richardii]|nr:hypothetical protein KP509_11G010000 [Ceratopteris richardii]